MSRVITGAVRNGKRVDVDFGWYKGRAGWQETPRGVEIAILGQVIGKLPALGTIDGVRVEVTRIAPSEAVEGVTVLSVRSA